MWRHLSRHWRLVWSVRSVSSVSVFLRVPPEKTFVTETKTAFNYYEEHVEKMPTELTELTELSFFSQNYPFSKLSIFKTIHFQNYPFSQNYPFLKTIHACLYFTYVLFLLLLL